MNKKLPSLGNLGRCPSLVGKVFNFHREISLNGVKEEGVDVKIHQEFVGSIRWQVEMAALTTVLIGKMWEEMKDGEFVFVEYFPGAGFWPNFVESMLMFFTKQQKLIGERWQGLLLKNDLGYGDFLAFYKRYLHLWSMAESGPGINKIMPDFRDFVAIVSKLNIVLEELFEQKMGREMQLEEARASLSKIFFNNLQIQLMVNNKKVAGDFLDSIQVAVKPKLKTKSGYGMPFGVNGKYNLDKFEIVGENPLVIWFKDEVVCDAKELAKESISMIDENDGYVKSCPVIYAGIFQELFNWYKQNYFESRFGVVGNS